MGLRDKARESGARPEETPEQAGETPAAAEVPVEETAPAKPAVAPRLEASVTYLVQEERPEVAYSLFLSELADGRKGMIVSRTYPKNLRKALKLKDVPILWLTNAMSDEAVGPKDLERLTLTIKRFLEESNGNRPATSDGPHVVNSAFLVAELKGIIGRARAASSLGGDEIDPNQRTVGRGLSGNVGADPAPTPLPGAGQDRPCLWDPRPELSEHEICG